MSLESVPIKTPTTAEIAEFIQNEYKSLTGATFIPEKGPVWSMSWALAAIYVLLYRFGTWSFNQIFFNSADASNKKERGAEYGMQQGTGQKATLAVSGGGGIPLSVLPAGTLIQSTADEYLYTVVSDVAVDALGAIYPQVKSTEEGEKYNLPEFSQFNLVSPLSGIPNTFTMGFILTPGADPETDEAYFARIDSRIKQQPQGGSPGDYYLWTTEVDGIIDMIIYTLTSGEIDVYPIASGANGNDKIPTAGEITQVEGSIDTSGDFVYNDRRPIDADVVVLAVSTEEYGVTITGFTSNGGTPAQETQIYDAILDYMGNLRPSNPQLGKTGDITEVNANVIFSIVNTITLAAGFTVDNVETYFDPNGTPILVSPKRALSMAKLAQFTGVTITS